MKRYRARIKGGYRRTTYSIPEELARRVDAHLRTKPGLTASAFVSEAIELHLLLPTKRS
jgi:hypothetical protein